MTEQEKQELIECCRLMIDVSRNHEEVMIAKISLASLSAPPVKLPESKLIHCEMDFIRKEKAKSWNEAINQCSQAIRAAGYLVEE